MKNLKYKLYYFPNNAYKLQCSMLHVTLFNTQFLTYSSVISVPTLLFCGDIHFVAIIALGAFRPCLSSRTSASNIASYLLLFGRQCKNVFF